MEDKIQDFYSFISIWLVFGLVNHLPANMNLHLSRLRYLGDRSKRFILPYANSQSFGATL